MAVPADRERPALVPPLALAPASDRRAPEARLVPAAQLPPAKLRVLRARPLVDAADARRNIPRPRKAQ